MDNRYIGEVIIFTGPYTPEDFVECDGSLLDVNQYQALYSVIGNIYGGDGRRFAVPNLQGRLPVGIGPKYSLGRVGGTEPADLAIQLTTDNLPPHTHAIKMSTTSKLKVSKTSGDTNVADGNALATGSTGGGDTANVFATSTQDPAPAGTLSGLDIATTASAEPAGKGTPVKIGLQREPFLAVRYIMCINGVYPPRSNNNDNTPQTSEVSADR